MTDGPEILPIPEEIWEQLHRLEIMQQALSGAFPLAELARDPHRRRGPSRGRQRFRGRRDRDRYPGTRQNATGAR